MKNKVDKHKIIFAITLIVICLIGILSFFNTKSFTKKVSDIQFIMSTYVDQVVYGKNAQKAVDEVNEELRKFEREYSYFLENSLIYNINKNAGIKPLKLNDDEFDFFDEIVKYMTDTNGVFDITVAPINDLWNILGEQPKVPTKEQIEQTLTLVNYKNIELNYETKTIFLKQKGMKIDLGGIAKGKATDIAKKVYKQNDIYSGYISIGRNIFVYNGDEQQQPMEIGIVDPLHKNSKLIGSVYLKDEVIATSGGYERFFVQNGKTYHHIMDTRTGSPSDSDILSVSIITKNGALGDMLSTYFFIMGSDALKQNVNSDKFSFVALCKNGDILVSNNMKEKFKKAV